MLRKMSIWLAVVACVCAAGCTSKIRGDGTAAAPAGSSASTGGSAPDSPGSSSSPESSGSSGSGSGGDTDLADLRKVDVCSYLQVDTFKKLDPDAKPQVSGGSYDNCFLNVTLKKNNKPNPYGLSVRFIDGSDAKVVGSSLSLTLKSGSQSGMPVFSGSSPEAGCAHALVLAENLTVALIAKKPTGGAPAPACPVADAMLDSAIQAAQDNRTSTMHIPADSLAEADLCAKFGDAVTALLGSGAKSQQRIRGCSWVGTTQDSVSVSLNTDSWPPGFPVTGAKPETLNGHPATVGSVGGPRGLSVTQIQAGRSPLTSDFDVITAIVSVHSGGEAAKPKVHSFLAAVAGTL